MDEAIEWLRRLSVATVDDSTLQMTDRFLPAIAAGRRVVATFDAARIPGEDEVVIIYGNYPHMYGNVVVNNPIRRHVADFWAFRHDVVEYDDRWDGVGQIFIINVDSRRDRYDGILRELATARAPLHRVTRVPAHTVDSCDPPLTQRPAACLRSHIDTVKRARAGDWNHVLVLEDDFCFTSDLDNHLSDLRTFVERDYAYWICLVATSKYGPVVKKDGLVSLSFQQCTNAGGYLLSRPGIDALLPVFENALTQMKATADHISHAADRCWSVLQSSEKFLVFNRKFGFQVASYSDIEGAISRYLD
jgi:hypothetical protein